MKRLFVLFTVVYLITLPGVLAVESHEVEYSVENGNVLVRESIVSKGGEASFFVPDDLYDIRTWSDGTSTSFTIDRQNNRRVITVDTDNTTDIELEYKTSELVDQGRTSYFVHGFRVKEPTEKVTIRLILPEKAVLPRPLDSLTPPVNPYPDEVTTTGRRMVFGWEEEDMQPDDVFSIFVSYQEDSFNWIYLLPLIGLVALTGFFLYSRKKKIEAVKKRFPHLLEKEKVVVEELAKADENTLWQNQLQHRTGFTKSKLSRTLRKMEERNIIEKIPHGTSNKVRLVVEED